MGYFSVWAPRAGRVDVEVEGESHALRPAGRRGWWEITVPGAGHGSEYAYVLDEGSPLPDPRSPWQPHGPHGPSRMVDHARFGWTDDGWRGLPLAGSVIYELHVGTFTTAGTFDAAVDRLDHLLHLGVDFVEVMPVHAFPGQRGWGYDVTNLYAVHDAYGSPESFKYFVNACHARGLGVLLDVVYNHVGPGGDHIGYFGPYFTDSYQTPWGPAINIDGPDSDEVRRHIVDNALMWVRDYHVDGLRLDAVHAIVDISAVHLLEQLADEVHRLAAHLGRQVHVVAESDLGDPRIVASRETWGLGCDAEWNDDFHHAWHAASTGESGGYYADFGRLGDVATALQRGYVYVGQYSPYRGRAHGRMPVGIPGHRFLGYLQNHDQVGNRAQGERSAALLPHGLLKISAALLLTSPFTPLLFMGEEWGADTPWLFFSDHGPALADAVRQGRREEFAAFGWAAADVPDPEDPKTLERSQLDWTEPDREPHADLLRWHRELITLRRRIPELTDGRLDAVETAHDERARWLTMRRGSTLVAANLSPARQAVPVEAPVREVLLASAPCCPGGDGTVGIDGHAVAILSVR